MGKSATMLATLAQAAVNIAEGHTKIEPGSRVHNALYQLAHEADRYLHGTGRCPVCGRKRGQGKR